MWCIVSKLWFLSVTVLLLVGILPFLSVLLLLVLTNISVYHKQLFTGSISLSFPLPDAGGGILIQLTHLPWEVLWPSTTESGNKPPQDKAGAKEVTEGAVTGTGQSFSFTSVRTWTAREHVSWSFSVFFCLLLVSELGQPGTTLTGNFLYFSVFYVITSIRT